MKKFLQPSILSLALVSAATSANIPEPDVVFYGSITAEVGNTNIPVTSGKLVWEIRPKEGDGQSYTFTTNLGALAGNKYTYRINIPQQFVTAVTTLQETMANTITVEGKKELFLQHYNITVNGQPALLSEDNLAFFTVSEAFRSNHQQLNLKVSSTALNPENTGEESSQQLPNGLADNDNDGLPDVWEKHYGFGAVEGGNQGANADDDPDGDGWTNKEEYTQGSDPTVNNKRPLLISDITGAKEGEIAIIVYENGKVQLRLKVLDSDSDAQELKLVLKNMPEGLQLSHVGNLDQLLVVGDSITAAQLAAGEIIARYAPEQLVDENGLTIEPEALQVSLLDDGPLQQAVDVLEESVANKPTDYSIKLVVFRPSNIADPVRWIDGAVAKGQEVEALVGRTGQTADQLRFVGFDKTADKFIPSGNPLSIDNRGFFNASGANQPEEILDQSEEILDQPEEILDQSEDFLDQPEEILDQPEDFLDQPEEITDQPEEILAFNEPSDTAQRLNLAGNRSLFLALQDNGVYKKDDTVFNDGNINIMLSGGYLAFSPTNTTFYVQSAFRIPNNSPTIVSLHSEAGLQRIEFDAQFAGGPKVHERLPSEGIITESNIVGFGSAFGSYGGNPGESFPFSSQVGEFIAYPNVLSKKDEWSVHAYLMSKWKDYLVIDASRSVNPEKLKVNEQLDSPSILLGGISDDELIGGKKDDILIGGSGKDILTGGDGKDRFIVGDGDVINDFAEYASLSVGDVLDLTDLLAPGDAPLNQCLYFQPVESDTVVNVNTQCIGKDMVNGSDFTDATFTIKGQSLWNTDMQIIWRSGALLAGNHKTAAVQAQLVVNDQQTINIKENSDESVLTFYLAFLGGQPFEGERLKLPLEISGKASASEDYTLVIPETEYTDSFDVLESQKDANADAGTEYEIPVLLKPDSETYKIEFALTVIQDNKKEAPEDITIRLKPVPEYYDLVKGKDSITIIIEDGLDRVFLTKQNLKLYEGEQGSFTVNRSGSIDTPLIVDLAISGAAKNGEDYSTIASQVTFAAGESSKVIPVNTLNDALSEPAETIEIRILSNDRYGIDTENNFVQLAIYDQSLNFADTDGDGLPDGWEQAMGLNPYVSNITANGREYTDSDNDGLDDLAEYQANTNPMLADSDGDQVADGIDIAPLDKTKADEKSIKGYQMVRAANGNTLNVPVGVGRTISIPLEYLTSNGEDKASGLQFKLQYNADQLEFLGLSNVLTKSLASQGTPIVKEVMRGDYKLYTHEIPITWSASDNAWPTLPLPASLLTVQFRLNTAAQEGQIIMVGLAADKAVMDYAFKPSQVVIHTVKSSAIDILANTEDTSEEAVLLARYLADLQGEEMIKSADDVARIEQHIQQQGLLYDIDGDGEVNPLTDAVLLYRYLSGQRGEDLIANALGVNATLKTAGEIERTIEMMKVAQ